MMERRVLFTSVADWANVGFELSQALQSVGVEARSTFLQPHPFGYSETGEHLQNPWDLMKAINWATDIVFMHSALALPSGVTLESLKKHKHLYVYHGGTYYRQNHVAVNQAFNPYVDKAIVQTRDLWNLGAERKVWLLPSVNTDKLKPDFTIHNPLRIAHHPSSTIKGTKETIIPVLSQEKYRDRFQARITTGENRVSYPKNLDQMRKCDVYIEAIYPPAYRIQEWGVTALEAASLGKIVITNFLLGQSEYPFEYGETCPLWVANNAGELEERVDEILSLNKEEIEGQKRLMRNWVERLHSPEAVGRRMKEKVFEI